VQLSRDSLKTALATVLTLLGLVGGIYIFYFIEWDLAQPSDRVSLIRLMIVPIVIAGIILTSAWIMATTIGAGNAFKSWTAHLFSSFAGGFEISLFLAAWTILQRWISNPDISYLEPMFVAVGVSIAVLEYCRKLLGNLR